MLVLAWLALIFLLAFVTESMTEYIFGQAANHIPKLEPLKWLLVYVPLVPGIGLAFFYKIDLVWLLAQALNDQLGISLPIQLSWVGMVITGLSIGRGSNYVHDLATRFFLVDHSKP